MESTNISHLEVSGRCPFHICPTLSRVTEAESASAPPSPPRREVQNSWEKRETAAKSQLGGAGQRPTGGQRNRQAGELHRLCAPANVFSLCFPGFRSVHRIEYEKAIKKGSGSFTRAEETDSEQMKTASRRTLNDPIWGGKKSLETINRNYLWAVGTGNCFHSMYF